MDVMFVVTFPTNNTTIPIMNMSSYSFLKINTFEEFVIPIIVNVLNSIVLF